MKRYTNQSLNLNFKNVHPLYFLFLGFGSLFPYLTVTNRLLKQVKTKLPHHVKSSTQERGVWTYFFVPVYAISVKSKTVKMQRGFCKYFGAVLIVPPALVSIQFIFGSPCLFSSSEKASPFNWIRPTLRPKQHSRR